MSISIIKPLIKDSYLAVIKNSVGSQIFKNFYVKINGKKKDILDNGTYSCAFFVTNILLIFKLIKSGQLTVAKTIIDMDKTGWQKIKKAKIGCVIVWKLFDVGDNDPHSHMGFYVGNQQAVSSNYKNGKIHLHKYNQRPIENFYWHSKLDN